MNAPETGKPPVASTSKGVIRWLDGTNAGDLGYLKEPGTQRYLDGQWVLELAHDTGDGGGGKWLGDLGGDHSELQAVIRAAETRLGLTAGQSWQAMVNGYGEAYTADLPASAVSESVWTKPRPASTSSATAWAFGVIAIIFFPPLFGIIGIIFGAIGAGRGERGAAGAIAFCVAAMLFGMAFGYYTTSGGYWPWQSVPVTYYYPTYR